MWKSEQTPTTTYLLLEPGFETPISKETRQYWEQNLWWKCLISSAPKAAASLVALRSRCVCLASSYLTGEPPFASKRNCACKHCLFIHRRFSPRLSLSQCCSEIAARMTGSLYTVWMCSRCSFCSYNRNSRAKLTQWKVKKRKRKKKRRKLNQPRRQLYKLRHNWFDMLIFNRMHTRKKEKRKKILVAISHSKRF